jgi:hypothetical protein
MEDSFMSSLFLKDGPGEYQKNREKGKAFKACWYLQAPRQPALHLGSIACLDGGCWSDPEAFRKVSHLALPVPTMARKMPLTLGGKNHYHSLAAVCATQ